MAEGFAGFTCLPLLQHGGHSTIVLCPVDDKSVKAAESFAGFACIQGIMVVIVSTIVLCPVDDKSVCKGGQKLYWVCLRDPC